MKNVSKTLWPLVIVLALVLSACGASSTPEPTVDPGAIFTAAAETVAAQLTQTAMAFTPTAQPTATEALPLPTETIAIIPTIGTPGTPDPNAVPTTGGIPTLPVFGTLTPAVQPIGTQPVSGDLCDNSAFGDYSNFYGEKEMAPGEDFTKIWRVKNIGTCTWDDGYYLAFAYGNERLDGPGWKIVKTADFVAPGGVIDIGMEMTAPLKPGSYWSCWQMVNDRGVAFGEAFCAYILVVKK